MNRPIIGIISSKDDSKLVINQDYLDAVWISGGIGLVLPYTCEDQAIREWSDTLNGFLFSGGGDISPKYYGENDTGESKNICSLRDEFELKLLKDLFKKNKPILGICRGMQLINVFLGGKLNQHIKGHMQDSPRNTREQKTRVCEKSLLREIIDKERIITNSFHHQSIKTTGIKIEIDAYSEDGCIEAIHVNDHKFCLGVQWHPENCYMNDDSSKRIFESFVKSCL